jgi:hypothetical protein
MRIRRARWPDETYEVTIRHDVETNVVVSERWEKEGLAHREHGPALISRDPITGVIIDEKWFKNNELHRDHGPADILRKPDGRVYYSAWYQHGEKVPSPRRARRVGKASGQTPSPSVGP